MDNDQRSMGVINQPSSQKLGEPLSPEFTSTAYKLLQT
jgi:hypothetical protein